MPERFSLAFVTATIVALLGSALLRRVATALGFVDNPAPGKAHARATPVLGGVAVALGVGAGCLFAPGRVGPLWGVAAVAAGVAVLGLADDLYRLPAWPRLTAELAVAALVVVAGVHAEPTGVGPLDLAITVLWIVGLTNAMNLLDNADGLAAGSAVATGAGLFVVAGYEDQLVVATLAAAVTGASLGFLAFNVRPAAIFMGDSGSLFLGFVLAVGLVELSPELPPPGSWAVPLLLAALPILDTTFVTVSRLLRGVSPFAAGTDHLSHRLVARGLAPGWAVAALVGLQGCWSLLALLVAREVVPAGAGLALGGGLAVAVALAAAFVPAGRARRR